MLVNGYIGYLASIVDTTKKTKLELTNVRIVCNFVDECPEDLLGIPPDWEIEFENELLPRIVLVLKVLY